MVPGVGGGELILIAVVALVVVGPKDLPKLLRQLGRFVGKMRRMADEFKTSFDDMARQSELDDLRKEVEALRSGTSTPILGDMGNQMKAIESDIKSSLRSPPAIPAQTLPAPEIDPQLANPQLADPQLADPQLANPQLEGLPPKWNAGEAPPAIMPETTSDMDIVVKKPRARKSPPVIKAVSAGDSGPERLPEPAAATFVAPVDPAPAPPVKRTRKKATT